jgi:hypothetical protein
MAKMQQGKGNWEGSLEANSGAKVPQKTFWNLMDFKWSGGTWSYKRIAECPGNLLEIFSKGRN